MANFPSMTSRLVETVMINVDDFSDSFLTCGTCFSGYDTNEHTAKLLPCSHTVCRACLTRILETQVQPSNVFRCPICREQITFPPGGAASFPPAFIVNQLLDLLATQRRDVVPKCRIHSNQELLFCETCDMVFCTQCRLRNHSTTPGGNGNCPADHTPPEMLSEHLSSSTADTTRSSGSVGALNHNVISFNVAIKRCTEIMLYKMQSCVRELDIAHETVTAELQRLSVNKDRCIESINLKFAEIVALVERRQSELLDTVHRLTDEKQRALTQQLSLIQIERDAVCHECNSLEGMMDVRSISKAIAYLNEKLDSVSSLTEPRENAFLRYQDDLTSQRKQLHRSLGGSTLKMVLPSTTALYPPTENGASSSNTLTSHRSGEAGSSLIDIVHCLAAFGRILVSTTYPALCTARLPSACNLTVNLFDKVIIRTVDYNGRPQSTGGMDPIEVSFTDASGRQVPTSLLDLSDGSYEICLRPLTVGPHCLSVHILSRPIRGSPFQLVSRGAQYRQWTLAEGADGHGLIQPFAVAYGPYPSPSSADSDSDNHACPGGMDSEPVASPTDRTAFVYLLDTGNSRLLVVDPVSGQLRATLTGEILAGQAATGIAWSPDGLWVVNWRSRLIALLDPRTDQIVKSISCSSFLEPTSICHCALTGRIYVADNGAGCIFVCNPDTSVARPFLGVGVSTTATGGPHSSDRSWRRVTGLCCADNGDLLVATGCSIRIFSSEGRPVDCLTAPSTPISSGGEPLSPLLLQPSDAGSRSSNSSVTSSPGVPGDRTSMVSVSSTMTLTTNTSLHFPDSSSPSHHQRACGGSLRGQLGGVALASWSCTMMDANLGCCLLASYSDRQRSGVIVWPESAWRQNTHSCPSTTSRWTPTSPYLVEAEPGLRRLAGLVALPPASSNTATELLSFDRHLVLVDQGAQSVCRIRYA